MKIAFIFPNALPLPAVLGGATETLIQNIIDMNEHEKKLEIDVFCKYDEAAEQSAEHYFHTSFNYIKPSIPVIENIYSITKRAIRKFTKIDIDELYILKIGKTIKERNYDAIIVESAYRFIPYIAKLTEAKIYLHLHFDATKGNSKLLNKALNKASGGLICVSQYISDLMHQINKEIPNYVLKNVVDLTLFDSEKYGKDVIELRNSFGFTEEDIIILYSGRIIVEKGVAELVAAYKSAYNKNKKIKLLLMGSAEYGKTIHDDFYNKLTEEIGDHINRNIFFLGYIPHKKTAMYDALADIVVLPTTLVEEAAPLVVLEALSSGCRFIGSDSGSIPEMIGHQHGLIVNRDDDFVKNLSEAILVSADQAESSSEKEMNGRLFVKQNHNADHYYSSFLSTLKKSEEKI